MQLLIKLVIDAEQMLHKSHRLHHSLPLIDELAFWIYLALQCHGMNAMLNLVRVRHVRSAHVLILDAFKHLEHGTFLVRVHFQEGGGEGVQTEKEILPHILSQPLAHSV